MKNYLSFLFVLLLSVMVLGACSETTTPEEIIEPVEVEAEEPAEEEVEEEVVEEAAEEEAAVEEEEEELTAEEIAENEANLAELEKLDVYTTNMYDYTQDFSEYLNTLATLSAQAGDNPTIMFDEDWIMQYAINLMQMDVTIDQIRELDPPTVMEESHALTLLSMDEFEFVVDNMPTAIDNMDSDLIDQCSTAMLNGSNYLAQATEAISFFE